MGGYSFLNENIFISKSHLLSNVLKHSFSSALHFMAPEMCAKQGHHWTPPTCSAGKGSARVTEIKTGGYCL